MNKTATALFWAVREAEEGPLDQAINAAIELAHEDNFQTEIQLRLALWEHYGERAGPKS